MADRKWESNLLPVFDDTVVRLAGFPHGRLFDKLLTASLLSMQDYVKLTEEIRNAEDRARKLLVVLQRLPPPSFDQFCDVLLHLLNGRGLYDLLMGKSPDAPISSRPSEQSTAFETAPARSEEGAKQLAERQRSEPDSMAMVQLQSVEAVSKSPGHQINTDVVISVATSPQTSTVVGQEEAASASKTSTTETEQSATRKRARATSDGAKRMAEGQGSEPVSMTMVRLQSVEAASKSPFLQTGRESRPEDMEKALSNNVEIVLPPGYTDRLPLTVKAALRVLARKELDAELNLLDLGEELPTGIAGALILHHEENEMMLFLEGITVAMFEEKSQRFMRVLKGL